MEHLISIEDQSFKLAVERLRFPVSDFDHRSHVRLAYIYLVENEGVAYAISAMRSALLALLKHAGVEPSEKYHETITEAWILAVKHFMMESEVSKSSEQFIDRNPMLLKSSIMLTHYTKGVLFSAEARKRFVPPDLEPIPFYAN